MNDTVAPVPRYQVRRIKSESPRFSSPLATRAPVFWQLTMPRNAARRGLVAALQTYAIAISFDLLCAAFVRDDVFASASGALPAKQEDAATSVSATSKPHASHPFAVAGSDTIPSDSDLTASAETVSAKGAEKQPVSEWPDVTKNSEAASHREPTQHLPADASLAVPWTVVGSILRAYLLVLEHELRAALKKLSPARWKAASSAALVPEPSLRPLARTSSEFLQEGGALNSTDYPFLKAASISSAHQDAVGQPGGGLDGLVESAAQVWQGFLALAQANGYVSAVLPSLEQTAQQMSAPPPAQEHGDLSAMASGHLLVGRVKKTVQHIVNDIATLATVQQLVNDFARRLKYFLQGEQELRERIACLTAPDDPSGKGAEGLPARLSAEDRCAGFETPQNEEDRRALRLALEKQLNDVHRAAKDAAQLLFSILSSPEFEGPFERHNISAWLFKQSPLAALAWPLLHQIRGLPFIGPVRGAQAPDLESEEEAPQTRWRSSRSQADPAGSPGLAPRSLSSTPALRGQTLFTKEVQGRPAFSPAPYTPSPRRPSSSNHFYGAKQAFQCYKRPPDAAGNGYLQCQCLMSPETVQETTILEPVACAKVRRTTAPRIPVPIVEPALECYATPETPYIAPPVQAVTRPVDYMSVPTRIPVQVPEVPIQCSCVRPRLELECRRSPLRQYTPREQVKVVPEVVEHRAVEPVMAPLGCELLPPPRTEFPVLPEAAPETVLIPCECIEHSVHVPEGFTQRWEPEMYPAGSRESLLIPVECIMRSAQPEKVPCQCFPRPSAEALAYVRPQLDYAGLVECYCPPDSQVLPAGQPGFQYGLPE